MFEIGCIYQLLGEKTGVFSNPCFPGRQKRNFDASHKHNQKRHWKPGEEKESPSNLLSSKDPNIAKPALQCLANVGQGDMLHSMMEELGQLMGSPDILVRRKATMVLRRCLISGTPLISASERFLGKVSLTTLFRRH